MSDPLKTYEFPTIDESLYKVPHKLLEYQKYVVEFDMENPESKSYYQIRVNRFHKDNLNVQKFNESLNKTVKHFHVFQVTYEKFNGEMMQIYKPELYKEIILEKMTEEEVQKIIDKVYEIKLNIFGGSTINYRLIETEKYVYFIQVSHHLSIDGNGYMLFFKVWEDFYNDRTPYPDCYLKILDDHDKYASSQEYKDAEKFYCDKFLADDITFHPKYDNADKVEHVVKDGKVLNNQICKYFQIKGLQELLGPLFKDKPYLYNTFFIMAGMLHIAETTGKRDIEYCWNYHGRDTPLKKVSMGFFVREYIARLKLKDKINLQEICKELTLQSRELLHKPFFPYTLKYTLTAISILFQNKLNPLTKFNGNVIKEYIPIENTSWQDEPTDIDYLDIYYYLQDGVYDVEYLACPFRYTEEGFKKYIDDFTKCCFNMVKYWNSKEYIDIHQLFE